MAKKPARTGYSCRRMLKGEKTKNFCSEVTLTRNGGDQGAREEQPAATAAAAAARETSEMLL